MISIYNLRTFKSSLRLPKTCVAVYVGCAMLSLQGSPLGNPYHSTATRSLSARTESIANYRAWLSDELTNANSPQSLELKRLRELYAIHGNMRLQCWCYPQPCHAEVIREYLVAKTTPLF
jgi:hypothetical protein